MKYNQTEPVMSTLIYIIIATLSVSALSLTGGVLLFGKKLWQEKSMSFVSFAAGVLLVTALLDLLPQALKVTQETGIFLAMLFGIVVFFFLERFIIWFHHHDTDHHAKTSSLLILLGDAIHNVFDGLAISSAFLINPGLGLATTMAISAHEIPQELADFMILIRGGFSYQKALFFNFLSALTALTGAIAGFYFLEKLEDLIPYFLAFTAGVFIYITCSDLIPDMHQDFKKQKGWSQSLPFIVGMVLMVGFIKLIEHSDVMTRYIY